MQYGALDWIPEQNKDIRGKTGEIQVWNLVNSKVNVSFLVVTNAPQWVF